MKNFKDWQIWPPMAANFLTLWVWEVVLTGAIWNDIFNNLYFLIFSLLAMKFAMWKVMEAAITDASRSTLRVVKKTTTSTEEKWWVTCVNIWTIIPPWLDLKLAMLPPMTTFRVKCVQIIKNSLKPQKLLPLVVFTTSISMFWP